jgi:hypothetical protein
MACRRSCFDTSQSTRTDLGAICFSRPKTYLTNELLIEFLRKTLYCFSFHLHSGYQERSVGTVYRKRIGYVEVRIAVFDLLEILVGLV